MKRRRRVRRSRPRTGLHRRMLRAIRAAPWVLRLAAGMLVLGALWAVTNWTYHALRKPTELLYPVSDAMAKTPTQTWREYGPYFREHATAVMTPTFLAALAQVEGAGNPLARTYWRWRPSWHPFEIYRPASSALGMYQITDSTFELTRRDCQDENGDSRKAIDGEPGSCWFDSLYARVVPSKAVALTSELLDRAVAATLKRARISQATLQQKQDLAAVIHLCGAGAGAAYAHRHLRLLPDQQCGDHDVRAYLDRIKAMKRVFTRIANAG